MNKNYFRQLWCSVVLILFLSLTLPVQAQEGGFTETFDDPSLAGWEIDLATVKDGILRIEPDGFAYRDGQWGDFTLSLVARYNDGGSLRVDYRSSRDGTYVLYIGGGFVSLARVDHELGRNSHAIPAGEWARVEISVSGGVHTITLNNRQVIAVSDAGGLTAGGIRLSANGAAAEFDHLVLTPFGHGISEATASQPPLPATQPAGAPSGLPAYQADSWVRLGGPPGGLGYDIRMQPDNPDIMFVTDAFTGIFKSTDGGKSWFSVNQGIEAKPGLGIPAFCATIDPHDPNVVWVGTQLTGHLYRSPDGGQTWEQRDSGIQNTTEDMRSLRGITIDPNNENIVYIGVEVTLTKTSSEREAGWKGTTAGEVYKSTDGGLNWTRVWYGPSLARYVWVDPTNSNRIYVSTGIFDRDAANRDVESGIYGGVGILRSDDGGQTWKVLNEQNGLGGLYIPSLFMHPGDPDTLLAAITMSGLGFGEATTSISTGAPGVYVTYDGGDTWQSILAETHSMDAVEISTSNLDIWYAATENIIFRSDDAGQSWQRFDMVTPDRKAGMPIDLQVDPRDPYRIFVNNYNGGNMMSTDGGATWTDASKGYTGLRVHTVAVVPGTGGGIVLANEFRSQDGGLTWIGTGVPARSFAFFTPKSGSMTRIMAAALYGPVYFSDDGGQTWSDPIQVADTQGRPLNPVLAVSPSDPDLMYIAHSHWNCLLGGGAGFPDWCQEEMPGLFRSLDGGQSWESLPTPFGNWSVPALAVHPDNSETIFAGTLQGLFVSYDGGSTWERNPSIDRVALAEGASDTDLSRFEYPIVWDLVFDPFDHQTIYAATLPGAVLRSQDGGVTWEQIASGMNPNEPIDDLLPDPHRKGLLYAGSRFSGVFYTLDGGGSWQPLTNGLIRKDVSTLALSEDGSILYAGTASGNGGAGVWRLGTPVIASLPVEAPTAPPAATEHKLPAETGQPTAPSPAATPLPKSGGLPCLGGALPLAVLGLVWLQRKQGRCVNSENYEVELGRKPL